MATRHFQSLGAYKRIYINPETRRMTLPEPFYDALGLTDEVMIAQVGQVLVMRNPDEMVEMETELLSQIVEEGFAGQELIREFAYRKAQHEQRLRQHILQDDHPESSAQLEIEL
ncbi:MULTISPECIES: hypothetical protein [Exiguobacterium]|uniref:SpoVT-AbrB domain-containing protein n=1 Tax=Exiguobacterium oxidotolerans TaxID=223958 RepID=A0A653IIA6_9BACL|nr:MULTISPECIES: hypothetical protein [Exiguobacterium]ASI35574.1 hypothetical protein A0126_08375 [Exiguobacterium sp. N4-1P]ASI37583.1 hypothetical protein A0126_18640 [Exiguobacterium sp. N4-1P]VWX38491.1 conserved hypothetical protein [Exiguobacterium oxidotolerans]